MQVHSTAPDSEVASPSSELSLRPVVGAAPTGQDKPSRVHAPDECWLCGGYGKQTNPTCGAPGCPMQATLAAKERPILFSAPMVRALLAGTKTQTRREIVSRKKAAPYFVVYSNTDGSHPRPVYSGDGERGHYIDAQGYDVEERIQCPYGHTDDQLWVRETWSDAARVDDGEGPPVTYSGPLYRADRKGYDKVSWKPSMHMPRAMSRIQLEITGVRVERLQDISEADAKAEGAALWKPTARSPDMWWHGRMGPVGPCGYLTARDSYAYLWESINGKGSWDVNPWVWVVEFRRIPLRGRARITASGGGSQTGEATSASHAPDGARDALT